MCAHISLLRKSTYCFDVHCEKPWPSKRTWPHWRTLSWSIAKFWCSTESLCFRWAEFGPTVRSGSRYCSLCSWNSNHLAWPYGDQRLMRKQTDWRCRTWPGRGMLDDMRWKLFELVDIFASIDLLEKTTLDLWITRFPTHLFEVAFVGPHWILFQDIDSRVRRFGNCRLLKDELLQLKQ